MLSKCSKHSHCLRGPPRRTSWVKFKISSKFTFNHLNSKLTFLLLNQRKHVAAVVPRDLLALACTQLNHVAAISSEATRSGSNQVQVICW